MFYGYLRRAVQWNQTGIGFDWVTSTHWTGPFNWNKHRPKTKFVHIDVRTPEEFAGGYIDDAININFNSSNFRNEISELERGYTYLIYCRSGNRSRGALDVMVDLDFRTVYHLSAGITGWFNGGLPLTK